MAIPLEMRREVIRLAGNRCECIGIVFDDQHRAVTFIATRPGNACWLPCLLTSEISRKWITIQKINFILTKHKHNDDP